VATPSFSKQVEAFARKVEAKYRVVARESVQQTVSLAQRTRGEGGRMRVKTGFLRASIQAALDSMPSGPTQPRKGAKDLEYEGKQIAGEPLSTVLLRWDPVNEQDLYVGWTANYAQHRETLDGFLRGAVEQWDQTVANAVLNAEIGLG